MSPGTSPLRAAACALLLSACHAVSGGGGGVQGDGVAKTESREVPTFDAIELDGTVRLELTTGPLDRLSITGDENVLPLVSTTVSGGKLVVRETKDAQLKTPLVVTVRAPSVGRIDVNGAATVRASGLTGTKFVLASRGASNAELSGQVDRVEIEMGGAGRVRASGLQSKEAQVGLSGAGSVEVNASEKLKADVSGVGSVRYRGSPAVEKTVSGLGSVGPLG